MSTGDDDDYEDAAEAPPVSRRAIYVGDSISVETNPVVKWIMASSNVTYAHSLLGGMAICDFFPETEAPGGPGTYRLLQDPVPPNLADLVRFMQPQVVALQFWGNSWQFTPCMRDANGQVLAPGTPAYYAKYEHDANRAMEIIRDAAAAVGAPMPIVLWVLQGPDRGNPVRPRILNDSYAALRTTWPTARTVDAGREVSLAANYWNPGDRYGWSQWLPCTQFERDTNHCNPAYGGVAQIHKDSDSLHFCLGTVTNGSCDTWSPGVFRYGLTIAGAMSSALP
ncbi:MAG: hypothetical protein WKG01_07500 [Kofleriaceae bacterium]